VRFSPEQFVADFVAGWHYLQTQSAADATRVGMLGFLFWRRCHLVVAAGLPELKAAVPFYGPPPPTDQIPKINAAVLAIMAGSISGLPARLR